MPTAALLYLVSASLYAGFQVTIRALVYPQMAAVPAQAWVAYENAHGRLVRRIVGPLFGALLGTVAWLLAERGLDLAALAAAVLLGLLLGVTAFGAAPLHTQLGQRFDATLHRRLLRRDTVRVAIALAQVLLGLATVLAHDS